MTGMPACPPRRGLVAVIGGLVAATLSARAAAAQERGIVLRRAAPPQPAAPDHFIGSVEVSGALQAEPPARAAGGTVHFAAGARTDWHTHPLGQTLVVLSGAGLVQRWDDPAERLGPGDLAFIPPGACTRASPTRSRSTRRGATPLCSATDPAPGSGRPPRIWPPHSSPARPAANPGNGLT